jgi:hypothetical protein
VGYTSHSKNQGPPAVRRRHWLGPQQPAPARRGSRPRGKALLAGELNPTEDSGACGLFSQLIAVADGGLSAWLPSCIFFIAPRRRWPRRSPDGENGLFSCHSTLARALRARVGSRGRPGRASRSADRDAHSIARPVPPVARCSPLSSQQGSHQRASDRRGGDKKRRLPMKGEAVSRPSRRTPGHTSETHRPGLGTSSSLPHNSRCRLRSEAG